MKHLLHMMIGCGLPILLIFALPLIGVSEGVALTVFIILMLGCHLLMMRGMARETSHSRPITGRIAMNNLSVPRFGFAIAAACAIAYAGCVFVMMTVPQETAIRFFNSLMHGVDVTSIMRWDMPIWETVLGIAETFVLGWLFGALIAGCYNCCAKTVKP